MANPFRPRASTINASQIASPEVDLFNLLEGASRQVLIEIDNNCSSSMAVVRGVAESFNETKRHSHRMRVDPVLRDPRIAKDDPRKIAAQRRVEEADEVVAREEEFYNAERAKNQHNGELRTKMFEFMRDIRRHKIEYPTVHIEKGMTLESVRVEIVANVEQTEKVQRAPATGDELNASACKVVDEIASKGALTLDRRIRNSDPVKFTSQMIVQQVGNGTVGDGGTSFFVFLLRDQIKSHIAELIGEDAPGALSNEEQKRQLDALADRRLELERIEEVLIRQALADGRNVQRRLDADPRAILGIEIVER